MNYVGQALSQESVPKRGPLSSVLDTIPRLRRQPMAAERWPQSGASREGAIALRVGKEVTLTGSRRGMDQ